MSSSETEPTPSPSTDTTGLVTPLPSFLTSPFLLIFSYAHFLCLLHRHRVLSFLFCPILPLLCYFKPSSTPSFFFLLCPHLSFSHLPLYSTSPSPTVLQECVAQASPELIGMVLRYRDQQQSKLRSQEIPLMLDRLQTTPDYYIEMRWEVSSWGECV